MKKNVPQQTFFVAFLLLGVSLLAYGWMVLHPGFFGDDITLLWLHQRGGLAALNEFFGYQGTAAALFISGLISAFGQNAWIYQLTAILLRWMGAWSFWLLINEIWPRHQGKALLASLIFLVFPGLKHMPLAISILPHLLALCLTVSGFHLLHQAILEPKRRRFHFGAAWLTGISSLLSSYFIGLEILRIVMIWKDWRNDKTLNGWRLLLKTLLTWSPFVLFLAIRIIIGFPTGEKGIELLSADLLAMVKTALRDLIEMTVLAWRQIFQFPQERNSIVIFILVIVFAGLLVFLELRRLGIGFPEKDQRKPTKKLWGDGYLVCGLAVFLAGGLPVWLGGFQAGLNYPDSILALAFLPGTALIIAGGLDLFLLPRFQAILAALLVALSAGAQLQNSVEFVTDWNKAESLVLQMHNRLPAVDEGTVLVSEQVPLDFYSEDDLSAYFNLLYFSSAHRENDNLVYLDASSVNELHQQGNEIEIDKKGLHFNGSLEKVVVFYLPPEGCLRVLEAGMVDPSGLPFTLGQTLETLGTNLNILVPGKSVDLPEMIGEGAAPQRCMILEQIELANQKGKSDLATQLLYDDLDSLKQTTQPYEFAPLVFTAANSNDPELLSELVHESSGSDGAPFEVCQVLRQIEGSETVKTQMKTALHELKAVTFCENYD